MHKYFEKELCDEHKGFRKQEGLPSWYTAGLLSDDKGLVLTNHQIICLVQGDN
ncbi:MAG: hypothetical protein ACR2PX_03195 [Endozoicomonas sp.]|uniref:hypothetical protein n=1 Tax=Endozoicomonas sp. TaxID=1892382 RepID=UPI003D9AF638